MKKVYILFHRCKARDIVVDNLKRHGLEVKFINVENALRKRNFNCVWWGGIFRHRIEDFIRFHDKKDVNKLYIENGLLCQKAGFYMDDFGYMSSSSIVEEKIDVNEEIKKRLDNHCIKHFNWNFFNENNKDGPILFCCQLNHDFTCNAFYKKVEGYRPLESAIKTLSNKYKNSEVIVRVHPRQKNKFNFMTDRNGVERYFGDSWSFMDSSVPLYDFILKCSKIIAINSTVLTEAATTKIDIEPLGEGCFSGININKVEERLEYVSTVFNNQVPYDYSGDLYDDFICFRRWFDNLIT
ncbi:MAG: hypothetical protein ACOC56_03770 [Atribacterota bacterium]